MQTGRITAFDGIRGCAALSVILYHYFQWGMNPPSDAVTRFLCYLTRWGWTGVIVFFVLSGFLITDLLFKREKESRFFSKFYIRRACRILPAYFFTVALVAIVIPHSLNYVFLSSFFLGNFSDLFGVVAVYGPLWSVCVEEHFYLVWPWLAHYISPKFLQLICFVVCLISPTLRTMQQIYSWQDGFYTWYWMDCLGWGALLALWIRRYQSETLIRGLFGVTALIGITALLGGGWNLLSRKTLVGSALGPTLISLGTACAIAWIYFRPRSLLSRFLNWSPLQNIGKLSYGLYLYHCLFLAPVLWASYQVETYFSAGVLAILRFVVGYSGSYLLASVSYKWLETPFINLKDKLTGSWPSFEFSKAT